MGPGMDQGYGAHWSWKGCRKEPVPSGSSLGSGSNTSAPQWSFELGPDGGLLVDEGMRTTGSPLVLAAGDCASLLWPRDRHSRLVAEGESKGPCLWKQMRLWSQARTQGCYAAACIAGCLDSLELEAGYNFELFAHRTNLLGMPFVAMGLHQGIDSDEGIVGEAVVVSGRGIESMQTAHAPATLLGDASEGIDGAQPLVRMLPTTPHDDTVSDAGSCSLEQPRGLQIEYRVTDSNGTGSTRGAECVKLVRLDGKIVGAILVGEDAVEELVEPLEQLLLSDFDASVLGVDLLDDALGVADTFD